ncbi:hypothetical protein AMAG_00157 [Allomyces macrogynus ATCC 38327]|uniref:Uncharacterized protein n=1 Tax=Allomyces macrogynus (strain ATCC 38327) TaxID=578462 RepID=A0A0L0RVP5_ALLM3|nr:hypothetical protein AMAG_00157 [Allomyces macrogynus ATCC 38327]|eukprot:KNE54160.1 hypothetical protein AMAG_00157 [Allomyces macrogynus ATCC 38327]
MTNPFAGYPTIAISPAYPTAPAPPMSTAFPAPTAPPLPPRSTRPASMHSVLDEDELALTAAPRPRSNSTEPRDRSAATAETRTGGATLEPPAYSMFPSAGETLVESTVRPPPVMPPRPVVAAPPSGAWTAPQVAAWTAPVPNLTLDRATQTMLDRAIPYLRDPERAFPPALVAAPPVLYVQPVSMAPIPGTTIHYAPASGGAHYLTASAARSRLSLTILPVLPGVDPVTTGVPDPSPALTRMISYLHPRTLNPRVATGAYRTSADKLDFLDVAMGPGVVPSAAMGSASALPPQPWPPGVTIVRCPRVWAAWAMSRGKDRRTGKTPRRHYVAVGIPAAAYRGTPPPGPHGGVLVAWVDAHGKMDSVLASALLQALVFSMALPG